MKIKTLTYTERKVLAQYEYAELTSTAELSDDDNEADSVIILMEYVRSALNREITKIFEEKTNGKVSGECNDKSSNDGGNSQEEQIKKEDKADKKTKKRAEKKGTSTTDKSSTGTQTPVSDETSNIPAIPVEEVKPVGKNVEVYNSNIAEHKSIFAGYLAKKYDNSWKTAKPVDEIKSFTASLNGKHFLDNDGKIVESFLNLVHEFFGA